MVKADMSRDYYGDLELPASASEAEIKKQFKKLALKYHPDRNPGRESEVNSQFQTIQSAHEVLIDPVERQKYDAGRRRGARGAGAPSFGPASTGPSGMKGNPWANAGSEWAPPPKPPGSRRPPPPSAGASRYTSNFNTAKPTPPRRPAQSAEDAAEERKNNYNAWENMRKEKKEQSDSSGPRTAGSYYKPTVPAPDYKNYNGREASNAKTHKYPVPPRPGFAEFRAEQEGLGRTPSQKRNGYTPSASGADEPPAPSTSAYFTRNNPRPVPPIPKASPNQSVPPPPPPDSTRPGRDQTFDLMDDEPRLSTPYTNHGGERFNPFEGAKLNRTGTKEGENMTGEGKFANDDKLRDSASSPRFKRQAHISTDSFGAGSEPQMPPPRRTSRTYTPQKSKAEEKYTPQPTVDDDSSSDESNNIRARPMANPRRRMPPSTVPSKGKQPDRRFLFDTSFPRDSNGNLSDTGNSGGNSNRDNPSQYAPQDFCRASSISFEAIPPRVEDEFCGHSGSCFPNRRFEASRRSLRRAEDGLSAGPPNPDNTHTTAPSGPTDSDRLNAFEHAQKELLQKLINEKNRVAEPNCLTSPTSAGQKQDVHGHSDYGPLKNSPRALTEARKHMEKPNSLPLIGQQYVPVLKTSSRGDGSPTKRHKAMSITQWQDRNFQDGSWNLASSRSHLDTNRNANRISSDADGSASSGSRPYTFANSAEKINTTFSPNDWHGKFQAGDYFSASADAGTKTGSRSRSPIKRKPMPKSTLNTDVDYDTPPRDASPISNSPGPVKFTAEEWEKTFKPQTFAPSGFPSPGGSKRQPRRTRTGSSVRVPAGTTRTGNAAMVNDDSAEEEKPLFDQKKPPSPNAMDIDDAPARNVPLEPLRADWRAGNHSKAPSPVEGAPPRPPKVPTATDYNDEEDFKTNLEDLQNVEPFQNLATGLDSFNDIQSTLPFTSAASTKAPIGRDFHTKGLQLPQPPKAPMLPTVPIDTVRPSPSSWQSYLVQVKAYMVEWDMFNSKMIQHFISRRQQIHTAYPAGWLEAFGDSGVERYIEGIREDAQVREWWSVAASKHEVAMCDFQWIKGVMRDGVDKAVPRDVPIPVH